MTAAASNACGVELHTVRRDGLGSGCCLRAGRGTLASNGRPDGDLRLMYRTRSACRGQPQQGELAGCLAPTAEEAVVQS